MGARAAGEVERDIDSVVRGKDVGVEHCPARHLGAIREAHRHQFRDIVFNRRKGDVQGMGDFFVLLAAGNKPEDLTLTPRKYD
jgi:hypothetical protein